MTGWGWHLEVMFNKMVSSNRKFEFNFFLLFIKLYSAATKGMELQLPRFSVAGFRDYTGSIRRHREGCRQEASLVL